jgi:hypothetical protein
MHPVCAVTPSGSTAQRAPDQRLPAGGLQLAAPRAWCRTDSSRMQAGVPSAVKMSAALPVRSCPPINVWGRWCHPVQGGWSSAGDAKGYSFRRHAPLYVSWLAATYATLISRYVITYAMLLGRPRLRCTTPCLMVTARARPTLPCFPQPPARTAAGEEEAVTSRDNTLEGATMHHSRARGTLAPPETSTSPRATRACWHVEHVQANE